MQKIRRKGREERIDKALEEERQRPEKEKKRENVNVKDGRKRDDKKKCNARESVKRGMIG